MRYTMHSTKKLNTFLLILDMYRSHSTIHAFKNSYLVVSINFREVNSDSIVGTVLSGLNREVVSLGRSIVIAL